MEKTAYTLTIDQGNTSAKLALWADEDVASATAESSAAAGADNATDVAPVSAAGRVCRHRLCVRGLSAPDIRHVCEEYPVKAAIWCSVSVRPADVLAALQECVPAVIELTAQTNLPLTVDYTTPATLGVDRLAAAVGAHSIPGVAGRDILVSDLGTAITYDHVTASGHYAGGNIAPGIWMRLCALNHYTARLPQVETSGETPLWGHNTESALRGGAINGVVAELEFYRHHLSADAVTVLTGGAATLVQDRLSFHPLIVPDLVSLGLDAILHHNGF